MSPPTPPHITGIYRYPIKGLTPEPLPRAALTPGQTLLADRRYAIENGPSGFDPAEPKWLPKPYFLMLQRDEWLAALQTHFDDASQVLTIRQNGAIAAQGNLETAEGRAAIEQFIAIRFAGQIKGPPKVLTSPGHSFSDVARKVVSIINLASVASLETVIGAPVHPLRFRANLYGQGWPAWAELDLVGREIAVGTGARLKVVKRIVRCAATNVDPDTGVRDLAIPDTLLQNLGHTDCGVYAEVIAAGPIRTGDDVRTEN
jgi:MOSC domain-containing protein